MSANQILGRVVGHLSGRGRVTGNLNRAKSIPVEQYAGPYEFTPGEETQIVSIAYKQAITDITINPIPENYGRIAWDGTALTVW